MRSLKVKMILPSLDEAEQHADTLILGPGEEAFPRFVDDFRRGCPERRFLVRTGGLNRALPLLEELLANTK